MAARTKVARARLTPEEHDKLEGAAQRIGISPSEYLRGLIVGRQGELVDIWERVENLTDRVQLLESRAANDQRLGRIDAP